MSDVTYTEHKFGLTEDECPHCRVIELERENMTWSTNLPSSHGWYWARSNVSECPEINNAPHIIYVGSDLRIRDGLHDYGVAVDDAGFYYWCGPIIPPTFKTREK